MLEAAFFFFAGVLLRIGETVFYLNKEINRCSASHNYILFFIVYSGTCVVVLASHPQAREKRALLHTQRIIC